MAEAWSFFSNPRNLAKITPPELGFEMLTPDLPPQVYAGMMIAYRVRPLLGIPMTWLSEITLVEEGVRFIDEQRVGPYAVWHHEHGFMTWATGASRWRTKRRMCCPSRRWGIWRMACW
jgi:ligand-binding SRPBCC domain-containing protein